MESAQLTPEQLRRLADLANGARKFYGSLVRRMEARSFPPEDPLYLLAQATAKQVNELWLDLHYRSCGMSPGLSNAHGAEKRDLPAGGSDSALL